jgi:hypothetical protein
LFQRTALHKVGAYCARNGADPRDISESSSDDVPRQDLDNFIGRLCHMDTIHEQDKNSTSGTVQWKKIIPSLEFFLSSYR